jgi:inosose dehydratase
MNKTVKTRSWRRREFLRFAISVVTAGPMLNAAERNIYWALGLVTWRGNAGWPQILSETEAAGFNGVEPFSPKFLNDAAMAELGQLLRKYKNLRMSSIFWNGQFDRPSERDRLIRECYRILGYLKRFGSDRLTMAPPLGNVDDEKPAIAHTAKMANEIGRIALEEYNIKADIHPYVGSLIENPRQLDMLMDQTDPKYCNLAPDTAQIWLGGGDPVAIFEKYKHRLIYMHYKDVRGYSRSLKSYVNDQSYKFDNVIELGRGVIDFPALHRILKSVNYKGWITIDLDNARISPMESARIEREYISRVLEPIYK